jgi:hypothetical protein
MSSYSFRHRSASDQCGALSDRLVAAGYAPTAVAAAISLIQSGRVGIIQSVIDGKIDVETAAQRARRRPIPRFLGKS